MRDATKHRERCTFNRKGNQLLAVFLLDAPFAVGVLFSELPIAILRAQHQKLALTRLFSRGKELAAAECVRR
jgi:hypothetical protein